MAEVVTIETPELGDRSYIVHDGHIGVVIDPQRDIDRVLEAAEEAGVQVACIAETHLHNDYVSGGRDLARSTGALHLMAGADEVAFGCAAALGDEKHRFGTLRLDVLATPGHTPHHVAYVARDTSGPTAVFTGGSLLFGTVGRTDLTGAGNAETLTRQQYRSAHMLVSAVEGDARVYPTHGFGSFCSSTETSGALASTIEAERYGNMAFTSGDEDYFVTVLLAGLTSYPRYYAHMGAINRSGPAPIDLSPPDRVDREELADRLVSGEWVVDLRQRRAFAAGHVSGTLGVELDTSFSTYLGWMLPWGTPVTLVGDTAESVLRAQRDLARIGIDRPAGVAVGGPAELSASVLSTYPVSDFAGLRTAMNEGRTLTVLDVRSRDELRAGQIAGAIHVHLPDLEPAIGDLPRNEIWVHCATGYRASIAASLLDRAGRATVLIDDDFDRAAAAGVPVLTAEARSALSRSGQ